MYKFGSIIITLFLTLSGLSQGITRLEIKSLPVHPSAENFYAAGSFNGWNPQDEQYKFKKDAAGNYFLELRLNSGQYEYKITRGGWDKVECRKGGAGIENRVMLIPTNTRLELTIEEWEDQLPAKSKVSTASKNVCIIDTAFFIPQLQRTRRIWIYLPPSYCDGSDKKYPVLYMHDGQNLFEDSSSFSGEWGVDEYFDTAKVKECIVVGIDNGNNKRLNEYNPYDNERFGKGEGNLYADFLVKTLKPFIDRRFRTRRNKENTFVAGSSMGGLISMYAVLKYPKVFGGVGVFSPAFWVAPPIYEEIKSRGNKIKGRISFYAGKQQGESMVPDILKAFGEIGAVSKSKMTILIRDDGKHNELTWRKEFPLFYEWMVK